MCFLKWVPVFHFYGGVQVETEMERVEAALKTSFRKEMLLKTSPQVVLDDLWVVNGQNVVACDDFFVDDLLDLSNEDGFVDDQEPEEDEDKGCASVFNLKQHQDQDLENSNSKLSTTNFSPKEDFGSVPTSELSVPVFSLLFLFAKKGFWLRLLMKGAIFNRQMMWRTSNGYPILSMILSLNSLHHTPPEF